MLPKNQLETMTSVKTDLGSQLKAMEIERNQLCKMVKALESELQEEHKCYDDVEATFQDLQEQLQRLVKMLQACICMVLMVTV